MVLGMDWLSSHRATLDCYKKEVKFHRPGKLEVKFRGIRRELSSNIISTMAAQRMLRKGCQGYLAYVAETEKEGILVDEIPVVREFPDVFPDDIAGLPPESSCAEPFLGYCPNYIVRKKVFVLQG